MLPIQSTLRAAASPENAQVSARFFKSGPGEYGEGDIFLGIPVPDTRKIVKQYLGEMNLEKVEILLNSEFHEERLAGALTLVAWAKMFQKAPFRKELSRKNDETEDFSFNTSDTI